MWGWLESTKRSLLLVAGVKSLKSSLGLVDRHCNVTTDICVDRWAGYDWPHHQRAVSATIPVRHRLSSPRHSSDHKPGGEELAHCVHNSSWPFLPSAFVTVMIGRWWLIVLTQIKTSPALRLPSFLSLGPRHVILHQQLHFSLHYSVLLEEDGLLYYVPYSSYVVAWHNFYCKKVILFDIGQ